MQAKKYEAFADERSQTMEYFQEIKHTYYCYVTCNNAFVYVNYTQLTS